MEGDSTQVPVHVTVPMDTVGLVVKVSYKSVYHHDHRKLVIVTFSFPCVSLYSKLVYSTYSDCSSPYVVPYMCITICSTLHVHHHM